MVDKVPQGFFVKSARLYALTRSLRSLMRHRETIAAGGLSTLQNLKETLKLKEPTRFNDMRRYGLYTDDIWSTIGAPMDREAFNRLTAKDRSERAYRCHRAQICYQNKAFLPVDAWITNEQDLKHQPGIDRLITVVKEQEDMELFRNQ
ncbi:uncharacterized protein LOC135809261 [Sycon ciliatum]|uniref:uncharacterized protein LOC135809261 n=1 Tax=Sycon ciliatum TaxID=27933 RepID=UPI0020AB1E9C|eukprot:scpid80520/ scgid16942/ 